MRSLILFLFCIICIPTKVMSQNIYIGQLIDSVTIKKETDKVYKTIESTDSLKNKIDKFYVNFIYDTFLNDNDIDPSNITEDYYLNGSFLKDLVYLKECTKYNKRIFNLWATIVYDSSTENVYEYRGKIDYPFYDKEIYDFIAKLFYNRQIDCVFLYPSYICNPNPPLNRYMHNGLLFFAVKDNDYFIIKYIETNTRERTPVLMLLKDYINCCWEEMTNLPRK